MALENREEKLTHKVAPNGAEVNLRPNRRHFLKLAGGAALAGGAISLGLLPFNMETVKAANDDWVEQNVFPLSGLYLSQVQQTAEPFNTLGCYWEVRSGNGSGVKIQVRTSTDGTTFGEWVNAPLEADYAGKTGSNPARFYSALLFLSGSFLQYRVDPTGVDLKLVGWSNLDSTDFEASPEAMAPSQPSGGPPIIPRSQWGANEGWRFANGSVIWPEEYRPMKAIVIHHSETQNVYNSDPAMDVRGIYRYHAVSKGWGDIGYNFLIDWKGNIYEGRHGGEDVVGGHAYQYNYASIGVCLIGSFKTTKPTTAQVDALVQLLAWKCRQKGINPLATTFLVDRANVACITGHRDIIDTTCPGDAGYSLIPGIRQQVAKLAGEQPVTAKDFGIELVSVRFSPTQLTPGGTLRVDATVKNTGTAPVESQDPAPGFTYQQDQTFESLNFSKVSNKFRFAVDYNGNTGVSHPYRWGFGKTLNPGETVTITGYIKLSGKASSQYWGSIVQEYVKYFSDNIGQQNISVQEAENPTRRFPSKAADPNIRYFNETGHNLGYTFRNYWEGRGGLPVFGYPLTEEFEEVNPSDGKTYTVQYFERNRFEYHPDLKGTEHEVLLGLLGVQLTNGRNFPKIAPFSSSKDKMYFPETGHSLSGAFARYWWTNGGLALFGYPISEEFLERNPDDGKNYMVQYYERNRFEYHPENRGTKYEVLLGLLGKQLLRQKGWVK